LRIEGVCDITYTTGKWNTRVGDEL